MKDYFKKVENNEEAMSYKLTTDAASVVAVAALATIGAAIGRGTVTMAAKLSRKTVAFMKKKATEFQEKQFTVPEDVVDNKEEN